MSASLLAACALLVQTPATPDSSFWRDGDRRIAIVAVAGTVALAVFDERIARWTRQPWVQGDSSRHDFVSALTVVNEVPLTVGAVVTYGVGRLTGHRVVADVGLHLTESLVSTILIDETIRSGLGRARPRVSPNDAFSFHPGRGLSRFEDRSFPSMHSAVAFATAAALSQEMRERDAPARRYLEPIFFGAAMIPGFTRMYLDQHWASDIFAGSVLGAFMGARVVRYAHGHRTRLDRVLLGARVMPRPDGASVGWSLER